MTDQPDHLPDPHEDQHPAHRAASAPLKQLLGVENPDHE